VQCDVCQSDAYKNQTDGLAKLVEQKKSDQFWLFRVNEALQRKFIVVNTVPAYQVDLVLLFFFGLLGRGLKKGRRCVVKAVAARFLGHHGKVIG
jgi:hypothetical protein